jgi:hypothetical protein
VFFHDFRGRREGQVHGKILGETGGVSHRWGVGFKGKDRQDVAAAFINFNLTNMTMGWAIQGLTGLGRPRAVPKSPPIP